MGSERLMGRKNQLRGIILHDVVRACRSPNEGCWVLLTVAVEEICCQSGRRLGEGAFGVVYEAKWRGQRVAVKVLSRAYKGTDRKEQYDSFASEVKAMSHVGQVT